MKNKLMVSKECRVSVGIPTYEGGLSLIRTLESIYAQTYYSQINRILVVVDGKQLDKNIKIRIKDKKVVIVEIKKRTGQAGRINDLLKILHKDVVILTNDDVILDDKALEFIVNEYVHSESDLVSGCAKPIKVEGLFRAVLNVGIKINHTIASKWRSGNNYLSCNGRLLLLSPVLVNKISIPIAVKNNDAFIYLYAVINGFKYLHSEKSIVYYSLPSTFTEHLKQSLKFSSSYIENQKYFKKNLSQFYNVPIKYKVLSFIIVLIENPAVFIAYFFVYLYSRIVAKIQRIDLDDGIWETDLSTKQLNHA